MCLPRPVLPALLMAAFAVAASACFGAASTPTPVATPTPQPSMVLAGVKGIVDPEALGWPRSVEALNGTVTIQEKPLRVHTVSLGHDEVTYGLVPSGRVVATGKFTQNETYSNVAHLASTVPAIGRDPEQIIAQDPDLVLASPFANPDLLDALGRSGIPVVQMDLEQTPEGRIQDILFLGYVLGEVERAVKLAEEVRTRLDALKAATAEIPQDRRARVASINFYSDKFYTAGAKSTEGSIIEVAGGVNAAASAGLERNPTISLETIIIMDPELIIIPQPGKGGEELKQRLLSEEAIAEVPAIRDRKVFVVSPRFFTTLSFWNIRGAEELAKMLYADKLGSLEFLPFSFPG